MKASSILSMSVAVLLFSQGCTKDDAGTDPRPIESETKSGIERLAETGTASGTLIKLEVTSFMYGTHALRISPTSPDSIVALKSDLDLDKFIDKKVNVRGKLVDGYPVDGGPSLLNVTSIEEAK